MPPARLGRAPRSLPGQERARGSDVTTNKGLVTLARHVRSSAVPEPARRREVPEDVVARLRAGDSAAFVAVYDTYRARLHAFLLRLTGDVNTARDLGQETWLRLAASASRLAPDTDPGAWLFTVARNLLVSQRRWLLTDRQRLRELGLMAAPRSAATPLEQAAGNQLQRQLERALLTLPLRHREVVLLVCTEGFAAPDVARMLDLDPATVRKRLSRGRASLKEALASMLTEEDADGT